MISDLATLDAHLRRTSTFEAQAASCARLIEEAASAHHLSILATSVHLRDGSDYEGMWTTAAQSQDSALDSALMWRWIEERGEAVIFDTILQMLSGMGSDEHELAHPSGEDGVDLNLSGSMLNLLNGSKTHILAAPLRARRGLLRGMITVEIEAPEATGMPEVLAPLMEWLVVLGALAGPQMCAPQTESREVFQGDELLPVVGEKMSQKIELLRRFSGHSETLLLSGASGTGKSRMARWCHEQSPRAEEAFETLNLLAVPPDMQMAELFGWKKGAFTGAVQDVPGALERAGSGTLFLDEIDKLSLKAQAGLLGLMEEGTWRPMGDTGPIRHSDARFIVGTNVDLWEAVEEGAFREDLYYRINVLPVHLPSLRERRDEIAAWGRFMLERCADGAQQLTPEALTLIERQSWPGNLRQLDNVMRRAAIVAAASGGRDAAVDAEHIEMALEMEQGRRQRAESREQSFVEAMHRAAATIVEAAKEARRREEPLDLSIAESLRGYVMEEAISDLGDIDEALFLFGRDTTVSNRNQKRFMRRERERMAELEQLLKTYAPE